ncbi:MULTISPECIES: hypothetical protein [Myroides]|uniref:Collagen-like protein n=1 Tax=Myroides odoratimimus TaxID=76832 RepID=A0AAI8C725_9FLAO|nr:MULTISPECIES: hypothetical protein [Myroides]ALU27219.1 hypothetical protein AS202_14070 [Myroides odoratimimus]APA93244.1 hypothetical protein BK054_13620 [Myroides sp. ZB35]EHO10112.1 hypothetical protein HMPREF9714_01797 [Myroides odoratimimus CCUG 12901]EKB07187.1 hypothetical protein HMPREF9711_00497 [Myroides odoratimimus CCUG 3837]MCA4792342.1 hypothetical protein [Myroides odoratimimus]
MKKIAMLFAFVATSLLVGCEGSTGPQGPPGPPGVGEFPYVMETTLSFDKNLNDSYLTLPVKHPVELFKGDVILVFIKDVDSSSKEPRWYALPKKFYTKVDGVEKDLEYSYAFSPDQVDIIAEANAPLINFNGNNTTPSVLRNQVFRIMYIPGADPKIRNNSLNVSTKGATTLSYEEAVRKYNLEDVKVVKKY